MSMLIGGILIKCSISEHTALPNGRPCRPVIFKLLPHLDWIISIFTMFIYLSMYNSAAQIYLPGTKCWMREMPPSRSINPTKHRTVSIIPYGKHGHDSMLRYLYRNKSWTHITQIREEQDNPDWLSRDKRREVLSPFGGAGKGRWAEEIEAKKRTGKNEGPEWTEDSKGGTQK